MMGLLIGDDAGGIFKIERHPLVGVGGRDARGPLSKRTAGTDRPPGIIFNIIELSVMKERSGMPYDVVAFETDELAKSWTPAEEGVWHRLARHAWINGSIPNNTKALAGISRIPESDFVSLWPALEQSFHPHRSLPHRLINDKQEKERSFISGRRKQQQAAGRRSAEARRQRIEASRQTNARSTNHQQVVDAPFNLPTLPFPSQPSPSQPVPVPIQSSSPEKVFVPEREGTRAPAELSISEVMRTWAEQNQITVDLEMETLAMLDHYRGLGEERLDWIATWRNWMRKTKQFGAHDNGTHSRNGRKDERTASAGTGAGKLNPRPYTPKQ